MTIDETWFKARVKEFEAAILLLTRLRYGPAKTIGGLQIAQGCWAFPIVGALVGLIGAVVYFFAYRPGLTAWPAAALAVAATMTVTGCLHEDGIADTADGFGGGETREQKLAIMRDSRTGNYGVCVLMVSILLRVSALASLGLPALVLPALLAAHGGARAVVAAFMFFVPPARNEGLSAAAGQPPRESAAIAVVLGLLILFLCLGFWHGLVALIMLAVVAALLGWLALVQIDGQTGDVLGAVEQVSEIVILLAALA
ncbi:MAG: adenosylcobinamide-GDP ribazoletransferase [Xanthobacteraceae bacterium]